MRTFFWGMIAAVIVAAAVGGCKDKKSTHDPEQTQKLVHCLLLSNHVSAIHQEQEFWADYDMEAVRWLRVESRSTLEQAETLSDEMDLEYGTDRPGLLTLDREKAQSLKFLEIKTKKLVRDRLQKNAKPPYIEAAKQTRKENRDDIDRLARDLRLLSD